MGARQSPWATRNLESRIAQQADKEPAATSLRQAISGSKQDAVVHIVVPFATQPIDKPTKHTAAVDGGEGGDVLEQNHGRPIRQDGIECRRNQSATPSGIVPALPLAQI